MKRPPLLPENFHPQTIIIQLPDIFRLITSSKLPEAQKIEAWIFEEILPAVVNDGVYTRYTELQDKFAEEVKEYREKIGELETQVYNLKEDLDEDAKADRKYMLERQKQVKASIQLFVKRYTKRGDRADFHELYSAYQNSCSAKGEPMGSELEFENAITVGSRFVFERPEGRFVGHIDLDRAAMQRDFGRHYIEWTPPAVESQKPKKKTKKDDGIPMDEWKGGW